MLVREANDEGRRKSSSEGRKERKETASHVPPFLSIDFLLPTVAFQGTTETSATIQSTHTFS